MSLLLRLSAGLVLLSSCNRPDFEVSEADRDIKTVNTDNQIFLEGKPLTYSIKCFNAEGKQQYVVLDGSHGMNYGQNLNFTDEKTGDYVVNTFSISTIANEEEFMNSSQSPIKFKYFNSAGAMLPETQQTGVVDNAENIWLDPPRSGAFKVLNLSAYPYVNFPLTLGEKYDYSIVIGKMWASPEIIQWPQNESTLVFEHRYTVTGKLKMPYAEAEVECYKIEATTKSDLGQSNSIFYYNEKLGFVKMIFTNLNGSRFEFDLQ